MKKSKFSLAYRDPALVALIEQTDHKTLASWAIYCAERVVHYFERREAAGIISPQAEIGDDQAETGRRRGRHAGMGR